VASPPGLPGQPPPHPLPPPLPQYLGGAGGAWGPSSPGTRGWSLGRNQTDRYKPLVPRHAGLDRVKNRPLALRYRAVRRLIGRGYPKEKVAYFVGIKRVAQGWE